MDRMIRCLTKNKHVMACAVDSTYMMATAQQIHHTSPTAAAALGRLLSGASMMGAMLKNQGATVQVKVNGGGPLGPLTAIADCCGNCRGYVAHPEIDLPLKPNGKLDIGGAVGHNGLLTVMRDDRERTPYTGHTKLISGEIAEDLAAYYAYSEQIPTVCALGVLVGTKDSSQILSGGLLIQGMPGITEEELSRLETNAAALPAVTKMLAAGDSIEEMCGKALLGMPFEKLDESRVAYACDCSRQRVERALLTLPPEQILTLADPKTGIAEAKCQYCGRAYHFSEEELQRLAAQAKKRQKNN